MFEFLHINKRNRNEYIYPSVVAQDPQKSIITDDGRYDLLHISPHEASVVRQVLHNARSGKYPRRAIGLGLANESSTIKYKPRYILHEIIVQKYVDTRNPLDMLAVATAYRAKGAVGRCKAIAFYEKWIQSRSGKDRIEATAYLFDAREPFFSYHLAELYKQENRLDDALKYALAAVRNDTNHAPGYPLLIADIYKRESIDLCVRYLETIRTEPDYWKYANIRDEYEKAKTLQAKGYVFKPRAQKPNSKAVRFEAELREVAKSFL